MLKQISECELTIAERLEAAFLYHCVALDMETGAMLKATEGRSKDGRTKYILIFPNQTIEERGGYFARYEYADNERAVIRRYSSSEAIDDANVRLQKMLERRAGRK